MPNQKVTATLSSLSRAPATRIKQLGWKKFLASVMVKGRMVVTNHNEPEAVVLSIHEYVSLLEKASANDPLDALKRQFDERLAVLRSPGAGAGLESAFMATPEQIAEAANSNLAKSK